MWILDQLVYTGQGAKEAGETDRGAHVWECLKQDLVHYGSLPSHHSAAFVSILLLFYGGCFLNRKLKPQAAITKARGLCVSKYKCLSPFTHWSGSPHDTRSHIFDLSIHLISFFSVFPCCPRVDEQTEQEFISSKKITTSASNSELLKYWINTMY